MPKDEGIDYELVEGEIVPMSSGTPRHAIVRGKLESRLCGFLERNAFGIVVSEVDCRTLPQTVRRPDISFFNADRWRQCNPDEIPLPGAPDIAVEVLSPSESAIDVHRKIAEYLKTGSQEVWLLDFSNQEIFVHTSSAVRLLRSGDLLKSELLPGFSVSVSDVLSPEI